MIIIRAIAGVLRFILRSIKLVMVLIGALVVFLGVFYFFLDELPLGPVPDELINFSIEPVIDAHVHVAGIGAGDSGCFISEQLRSSYKYYVYLYAMGVSTEELQREGDAIAFKKLSAQIAASKYVKKAVVLAMDGAIDADGELDMQRTEVYVPNEYVQQEVAKYDNLLYGASINPYRKDALTRLIAAKQAGAVVVKWIPSIQHIDPAEDTLKPFYLALKELDLPLLVHTGNERSFTTARDELADPMRLELPLSLGVSVIAAHIATTGENDGQDNFERIQSLFAKYPNLHVDISSLTQINKLGYLKSALTKPLLVERMIYGTDWPLQFFPLISPWYFFDSLSPATMRYIDSISNQFDRDVVLKKALGVPDSVFARGQDYLLQRKTMQAIIAETSRSDTEPEQGAP